MKVFTNLFFCFITLTFCSVITWAQCPQGDVILTSQAEVDDFAATYPSCTEITGMLDIGIWSNTSDITDLSNLPPIESIGSDLRISYNAVLTDLSGLENLTSIDHNLSIRNSAALTDLSGLENLTSIGGNLLIGGNAGLTDLSGLENLTSIGHNLLIPDNDALTDLSDLENVTSIGGSLMISGNDALTDLSGLENVTSIGENLWIYNNTTLSICAVPPICDYLESGGSSDVQDNAPNCNTTEEILALCTVSTTTPDNLPQITISPNPGEGIFQINGIPKGTYQIHDTTGRIIQSGNMQNDLSIDISQEARSVYFISIQIESETITKRIIKM